MEDNHLQAERQLLDRPVSQDIRQFCEKLEAGDLPPDTISVRDPLFAVAGVADDLPMMRKAAEYLGQHPGTTLFYPPGTYRIDQIVDWSGDSATYPPQYVDQGVLYRGCQHVRIVGCRARIEVKGNFHKTKQRLTADPNQWFSKEGQIAPFIFEDCIDFELAGFEIDGNSEQMTFDPEINAEIPDQGIVIMGCHQFRLVQIYVHHFASDGILISRSTDFTIERVESAHHGRAALGFNEIVRDGNVVDSVFRDAGNMQSKKMQLDGTFTEFGGFSPAVGITFEPECHMGGDIEGRCSEDRKGGHVSFERTNILDNRGSGLSSAYGDIIENITFRDGVIRNLLGSAAFPLFLADGLVENSTILAEQGPVTIGGTQPVECNIVFRRNVVIGGSKKSAVFNAEGGAASLVVENNTFIGDYSSGQSELQMILIVAPEGESNWCFKNNWIAIPENAFEADYPGYVIALGRLQESVGNTFRSLGSTPWLISYNFTQAIHDHLTRPDGLIPTNTELNLNGCVDDSGHLDYVYGVSTCAH